MERIRLGRKRWPLVLSLTACAALELLLYFAVTRHALAAALAGRPLEGDWGWAGIAGWHLLIALAGLALSWQPLVELRTVFTTDGIVRPRLLAPPVALRWAEAESVYVAPLSNRPYRVRLNAPGRTVEINALYYERPDELMRLIEERMRAATPAAP